MDTLRKEIDKINEKILELLNSRSELVNRIGGIKREKGLPVYDPSREAAIVEELLRKNGGPLSDAAVKEIFRKIFAVSRELQESRSLLVRRGDRKCEKISLGAGVAVGGGAPPLIIAGPCSVESRAQMEQIGAFLDSLSVRCFRGGAFKPRTSPYSFQGLGEEGLKIMRDLCRRFGAVFVTEALTVADFDLVCRYADVIQIGARNMYNYELLKLAGSREKPVVLKRHFSATLEEFLFSCEYVLKEGNRRVILCERGIRTFEKSVRNTLDISAIPILKKETHLPVIADVSHSSGRRDLAAPLAKAALAAGADGVMIEIHNNPSDALSDCGQQLDFGEFQALVESIK